MRVREGGVVGAPASLDWLPRIRIFEEYGLGRVWHGNLNLRASGSRVAPMLGGVFFIVLCPGGNTFDRSDRVSSVMFN